MMQYNNSAQNNSNNSMGGGNQLHHQQSGLTSHLDHNKMGPQDSSSGGPMKRPLDSGPLPNNSKKANLDIDSSLDSIVSKIKEEHCTPDVKYNMTNSESGVVSNIKKETNDTKIDSNAKLKSEPDPLGTASIKTEGGNDDSLKVKDDPDDLKQEDNLGELDLKDFDGFDGMNNDAFQDLMDDLPEFDKTFYESLDFDAKEEPELDDKSWQDDLNAQSTTDNLDINSSGTSTLPVSTAPSVSQPNATEALKMMAQQHQNPPVCDSNTISMPQRSNDMQEQQPQQQQQQPTSQMPRTSMVGNSGPNGNGISPGMSNMGGMSPSLVHNSNNSSSANGMPTPGGMPLMNGPPNSSMPMSSQAGGMGGMPSSVPGPMPMSGPGGPMPPGAMGGPPGMGGPNQDMMLKAKMEEEARLRAQMHQSKFRMGNPNGMSNPGGMGGPMGPMGGQYGSQQQAAMMRGGNPAMYGMNHQMQVCFSNFVNLVYYKKM